MKNNSILSIKYNKLYSVFSLTCFLLISNCAPKPPYEKGDFKTYDLVELVKLDSTIHLDIRYATNNNLVGTTVYREARAFFQRPDAEALLKINNELKPLGYGLLIFDGYIPWSVTKLFWDITSLENKIFVANPKEGSRHNRGCAIDLSIMILSLAKKSK